MKKIFSLIRASMSDGMNLFKVSTRNKSDLTKKFLPIILAIFIMVAIYSYSERIIINLEAVHMEFVVLTLFVLLTSFLTIMEGIYKSGNLLFNCKDDNLLFSLPIKKSTVLFVRILKFYIFELLYNSIFIIPAMISYAIHMKPDVIYYIVSVIGLLIFPIVPILISCLVGTLITFISSKFKGKNIAQTIITIILILGVMYVSFNSEKYMTDIASNASNINAVITKIYYPAGAYINLVLDFNILKLFEFVFINLVLLGVTVLLIGKIYLRINSNVRAIKTKKSNKEYKIKTSSPIKALMKKEFNRFINSPVFVTNAGFGLILFILGCVLLTIKFDGFANSIVEADQAVSLDYIKGYIPLILFGLISFSSFMTSITSSMISLEGKSFNILKSLPVKAYTILKAKLFTAIVIMIPCILIGDIIVFLKFELDIVSMILLIIASFVFPLLSETIGIMVNLKYPRMDAQNDTEVVKQSMSSAICVFIGMALTGITLVLLYKAAVANIATNIIMLSFIGIYAIINIILLAILNKTSDKNFNNIVV